MADYEEEENESYEEPVEESTQNKGQVLNTSNNDDDTSNLNYNNDHVMSRDRSEDHPPPPDSPLSDTSFGIQSDPDDEVGGASLKRPHPSQESDEEEELLQKRVRLDEEKEDNLKEEREGGNEGYRMENDGSEGEEEEEVKRKEIEDEQNDNDDDITRSSNEELLEKEEEGEEGEEREGEERGEEEEGEGEEGEGEEEEGEGEEGEGEEEGVPDDIEREEEEEEEEGINYQELQDIQHEDSTKADSGDSGVEDNKDKTVSDFDIMMQRRKEAMARARKRRKKDIDITTNDDHILAMIRQMKEAAEEDRRLNLQQKAATKKLQLLPTIISHLKKADLITAMIECGMCSALADWLKPLPDHSLPHLKIREGILDALKTFPSLDGHILKTSGLGKSIMLLYKHPRELKKNREKAGKMINAWARPVFGLTADFKGLSRDEREERDWAHLSQAARRRLSSDSRETDASRMNESEAQKPGDKGWIGRARVPMPSNKDYVVRPKWNKQHEFTKGSSKKTLNRYEKQVQKKKEKMTRGKNTHAVSISIEGRNMSL